MPIANTLTVVKQTLYTLIGIRIDYVKQTLFATYLVNIDGTDVDKIEIQYAGQDWDDFFTPTPDPVTGANVNPIGVKFANQLERDLSKKKKILGSAV